jgi:hypothetical protein
MVIDMKVNPSMALLMALLSLPLPLMFLMYYFINLKPEDGWLYLLVVPVRRL